MTCKHAMLRVMMPKSHRLHAWPVAMACLWAMAPPSLADSEIDYQKDILPILTETCFECHGPDEGQRKAGLRLDHSEGATTTLDSGRRAIVPGDPERSELVARIRTADPDDQMPPPDSGKTLTQEQTQQLVAWIAHGAPYRQHWAYRPLRDPTPPVVESPQGHPRIRNEIDAFVVNRLHQAGLTPSPEADRRTLVKRLYDDLVGLLPDSEIADRFVEEGSEAAYQSLVDHLLSSPHFGERWGRHWLDKARYADSDGYEKDNPRPNAWRYRDWVIRAINEDRPFDDFTIQQLAGDLLPDATPEQRLATAFHRQTLTNTEGGTNPEQWRVAAVMDRTETTATVWLGLTAGCARCHTHKYDAITHREYYQLYAFFNNGDETTAPIDRSEEAVTAYFTALQDHRQELEALERRREQRLDDLREQQVRWEGEVQASLARAAEDPLSFHPLVADRTQIAGSEGTSFQGLADGSFLATGENPASEDYRIDTRLEPNLKTVIGVQIEALRDASLPNQGPGRNSNGNFVLSEIEVRLRPPTSPGPNPDSGSVIPIARASAAFSQSGWPVTAAFDGDLKTGWAVSPKMGQDHQADFIFTKPIQADEVGGLEIRLRHGYTGGYHNLGRLRISLISGQPAPDLPDSVLRAFETRPENRSDDQHRAIRNAFAAMAPELAPLRQAIQRLKENPPAPPTIPVRIIQQRVKNPRSTHILERGDFTRPAEAVEPGIFSTLPALEARNGSRPDRLDLARWLVSDEQPLTPRVVANDIWRHLFGEGLVRTPEDYGVRGEQPTHPNLLDHLAVRLRQLGWSRKELIRTIVTSATYRQSSRHRPEYRDLDPQNRLLARQNRFRLEAETLRDLALDAGGLLTRRVGGPSAFPPTSRDVLALTYNSSIRWDTSEGSERYRRGLYTFFKRTAPHPNLITFDCPDSNTTNVKRRRSNTPLGALTLLNNEVFYEAALGFASRVLSLPANSDSERFRRAFQMALYRPASESEAQDLLALLQQSRDYYAEHPEAAKRATAPLPPSPHATPELAAWTATVRIILNLDEFLTRD